MRIKFFFLILLLSIAVGCAKQLPQSKSDNVVLTAHQYLGVPYKYGGKTPKSGFDCSGFVKYVYQQHGIELPDVSWKQAQVGQSVSKKNLWPGDLVFFSTSKNNQVNHVGIYIGNRKFIHAPGTGKRVKIANLDSDYFRKRFKLSKRILR